jgi:hypothetical protein
MKKVFIGLLLTASLGVKSQTIDTSVHEYTAAKINNVVYKSGFPVNTDTLQWAGFTNYTVSSVQNICTVNYVLRASDGRNVISNTYTLTESEYTTWNGEDVTLLGIIGRFLGLTFK